MVKCPNQDTGILFPTPLAFSTWPFVYLGVTFCSLCVLTLTERLLSFVCWGLGCCVGIYCQALGFWKHLCMSGCGHHYVSGPGLLCEHLLCVGNWAAVWASTL